MEVTKKLFYILSGVIAAITTAFAIKVGYNLKIDFFSVCFLLVSLLLVAFFLMLTFLPQGKKRSDGGFKYSKRNGEGGFEVCGTLPGTRERFFGSVCLLAGAACLPFVVFFANIRHYVLLGILIAVLLAAVAIAPIMIVRSFVSLKKDLKEQQKKEARERREQAEKEALGKWK